ncbi:MULTISPECIES: asparagine synthase (glutamine-hydrolyzing) [unclassified Endozoicomonas]|uniref:asparagine synthase (glutamine-hydrolyzing) n=1 Tax=unclassified Endozoicomonas TaxID=2644528 RepID=UPI003BB4A91A
MCGILGGIENVQYVDQSSTLPYENALLKIKHRGPNDHGLDYFGFNNFKIAFGHTRLSIIDLSSSGHQPMMSYDGRYRLIFNGEIYNYREIRMELISKNYHFKSESDTEVLLNAWHLWGSSCLMKLKGMFAFVVFDQWSGTVSCVRDAFGIKPLYYYHDAKSFYFCSEISALLELVPGKVTPDQQTAYDYLISGRYDRGRSTFFNDIQQLEPGNYLEISLKNHFSITDQNRWWYPNLNENKDISFEDAAVQLRELFLKSVDLHLRSDVPIGAALSGGLDSSAIVSAMRYLEPDMPIHTFTYVSSSNNSEKIWADRINNSVQSIPHNVHISSENLLNDIDEMIACQGEPFGSTSIYAQYCVYKEVKKNNITVTLDGQGADELLAGYHGYPEYRYRTLLHQRKFKEALSFCKYWSEWPSRNITKSIFYFLSALGPENSTDLLLNCLGLYKSRSWLNIDHLKEGGVNLFSLPQCLTQKSQDRALIKKLYSEVSDGGLTSLLRHGDRNSMHWSIESRVPFLNTDIAEFLLSLPESYLISREGQTKHIFRYAMKGIVSDDVLFRRDKIGFETPEKNLMLGFSKEIIDWVDSIEGLDFINASKAKQFLKSVFYDNKPYTAQAWRLANFCKWYEVSN